MNLQFFDRLDRQGSTQYILKCSEVLLECTEVRFVTFLSGGFITAIVVNPPERNLEKRTSVQPQGCKISAVLLKYPLYFHGQKNTKLKFLYIVLSAPKNICFKVGSFYSVNYVNVIYSIKGSTVDCKYLLFLQDFAQNKTKTVQKMPIQLETQKTKQTVELF